jgi:hypothetical protein
MRLSRPLAAFACVASVIATFAALPAAQGVGYPHGVLVSPDPVNNTPHALDGTVRAIATVGNRVYVGGTFTQVTDAGSATQLTRRYLFAFDRTTRKVLPFAADLDGVVETIAPGPNGSIIIGGRFKTVNGAAQRSLAMLGADGTRVATFSARTDGYVTKALVRGTRLIVGGRFSFANGASRSNLAAFDATSGTLDGAFNIPVTIGRTKSDGTATAASILEMDATADGTRLVIVGNFRRVGGELRQQIAMISLVGNTVSPWFTDRYPNDVARSKHAFQCYEVFDTQMRDVEFAPNGDYFVVITTGGAPDFNKTSLCDTTARWDTTAIVSTGGALERWKNCTGGDTLYSTAVTTAAVYVGGHQRWLDNCGGRDSAVAGSFEAHGIGAIDPQTGLAIRSWNPGRTRGVGAEELLAEAEGLYIGSDTDRLAQEYHARLGLFPLP